MSRHNHLFVSLDPRLDGRDEAGGGGTDGEHAIEHTKSEDERVRLGAIQAALDRGWGKPTRAIEAEIGIYDSLGLAEQQALLSVLILCR